MSTKRFSRIPEEVLLDKALTNGDIRLYAVLSMHVFEGNICCIGQRRLATLCNCDRRTIRERLTNLARSGHISTSTVKLQRRAVFQLNSTIFNRYADAQLGVDSRPVLGVVDRPRINNRPSSLVSFPRKRG